MNARVAIVFTLGAIVALLLSHQLAHLAEEAKHAQQRAHDQLLEAMAKRPDEAAAQHCEPNRHHSPPRHQGDRLRVVDTQRESFFDLLESDPRPLLEALSIRPADKITAIGSDSFHDIRDARGHIEGLPHADLPAKMAAVAGTRDFVDIGLLRRGKFARVVVLLH